MIVDETTQRATAPACWLLDAGIDGVPLTQTHALARTVVREAAERWPSWWDADVHGPPHREADVAVLGALHEGLKRLRLMRRRGARLLTTARGRELAADPAGLLAVLAEDLPGPDPFGADIADALLSAMAADGPQTFEALGRVAARRAARTGWCGPDGRPPSRNQLSWEVGDLCRRGEAYGLVDWSRPDDWPRTAGAIALTPAGEALLGRTASAPAASSSVLVFRANLDNVRGVSAGLAVGAEQPLTALHDAIQEAFGWWDDHLYSFWTDGRFWGDQASEYTSPVMPDEGPATADVPLSELDLAVGAALAYVFDFGDEWRVRLRLERVEPADGGDYPRVLERKGQAPPQYGDD